MTWGAMLSKYCSFVLKINFGVTKLLIDHLHHIGGSL